MTGEVDRVSIIHLLEAAKGDLAKACADAIRQDPRGHLKARTERASDLYRVTNSKAALLLTRAGRCRASRS